MRRAMKVQQVHCRQDGEWWRSLFSVLGAERYTPRASRAVERGVENTAMTSVGNLQNVVAGFGLTAVLWST